MTYVVLMFISHHIYIYNWASYSYAKMLSQLIRKSFISINLASETKGASATKALIFTIAHFLLFGGVSVAIANQLNKSTLWAHAPKFSFWGCLQLSR